MDFAGVTPCFGMDHWVELRESLQWNTRVWTRQIDWGFVSIFQWSWEWRCSMKINQHSMAVGLAVEVSLSSLVKDFRNWQPVACVLYVPTRATLHQEEKIERAFSSCRYRLVIKPSMENPLLMVWQGFWFEHVQKMEFQWIPSRIPHWREFIQNWIGTLYKTTPDFIKNACSLIDFPLKQPIYNPLEKHIYNLADYIYITKILSRWYPHKVVAIPLK